MKRLIISAVLVLAYLSVEALGLRQALGVLTMTLRPEQPFEVALAQAAIFLLSWFGAVVAAPVLVLSSALERLFSGFARVDMAKAPSGRLASRQQG